MMIECSSLSRMNLYSSWHFYFSNTPSKNSVLTLRTRLKYAKKKMTDIGIINDWLSTMIQGFSRSSEKPTDPQNMKKLAEGINIIMTIL